MVDFLSFAQLFPWLHLLIINIWLLPRSSRSFNMGHDFCLNSKCEWSLGAKYYLNSKQHTASDINYLLFTLKLFFLNDILRNMYSRNMTATAETTFTFLPTISSLHFFIWACLDLGVPTLPGRLYLPLLDFRLGPYQTL